MKILSRLFSSFRLAVIWPLVVTGAVSATLLWWLLPRVLEESAAAHLTDTLPILAASVAERIDSDQRELQSWLETLARGGELRATVVRSDGVVLADSARSWEQVARMDNHRARPEIAAALSDRTGSSVRHSATTDVDYVYVARSGHSPAGSLFVLRLAQPLREVAALQRSILRVLLLTGLAALVAAAIVLWGLRVQLLRPLEQLVEGANRMARGDDSGRLEPPEAAELAAMANSLNRLSGRVEEQIEQAQAERNHLRQILSSLTDGILVTDIDGQVRFVNETFRELFEVEGDVEGLSPLEITRRSEIVSLIKRCLEDRRPGTVDNLSFEGGLVLAANTAPIGGNGVVLAVRDVTARNHLDATRRDFVANVSHEIKTPLTAIRGYAETLKEGALDDPEVAEKFTQKILGQCGRLEALLSDLLPLARLEASEELEHEFEPVDLLELVREAVEIVRPRAEKRGIEIEVDLPRELPDFTGDEDALEQLVLNLLENAVRYNREEGSVRIAIEPSVDQLVLTVADSGIGIPNESIPRVFERFYRVDKARAREEGGTGLGLALVKHAAKLHGGHVELQSQLGIGSIFKVSLPLRGGSAGTT